LPSYSIERLLDPTTSYSCLSNKPKQPCPPHPSKPLFGHVPCLLNHCLVCMLRMLSCSPVTPWIGLSHYYIIVDDVIIIMLTIFDEGWKVRLSRLDALFHSSHLGPEFRVLCLLTSVPNRVWDSMGSPLLTYLAPNISSGGPS
jgi:hypothetical protein